MIIIVLKDDDVLKEYSPIESSSSEFSQIKDTEPNSVSYNQTIIISSNIVIHRYVKTWVTPNS